MSIRRRAARRPGIEQLETRDVPAVSVGMNLDWITDYAPALVFKDAFLQSRDWMASDYNTVTRQNTQSSRPAVVDEHGWPVHLEQRTNELGQLIQQRLQTGMFTGINGAFPAGDYRAEWRGSGPVTFLGDGAVVQRGTTADGTNYAILRVAAPTNTGLHMRIDAMSDADPIRDVHVWLPDYNGRSFVGQVWRPGADFSPFHPLFTERLDPFSTIRFMQPGSTNTSDIVHWSDRREVTDARQSTFATSFQNGIAPEYMIALCNQLGADGWFNMPHMADDDYVRRFATLVRDTLNPGLKIYVEWSNEVWNFAPGFEGTYWVRDQTLLPENAGLSHWQIVARETKRDFDIWSEVFAGQSDRMVRVVGGFHASPGNNGINDQILREMAGRFDALAIAPYIGPTLAQRATYTAATTADQVLADTRASIAPEMNLIRRNQTLVDRYSAQVGRDLRLLAYEGGTHLDGRGAAYRGAFFEAAARPEMYDLLANYLRSVNDTGLDLYMHYKFTDRRVPALLNDDFGTLNAMGQPLATAHRYRALVDAATGQLFTPPASVAIVAGDAMASEAGNDPGTFVVRRNTQDLSRDLFVRYAVTGSATAGIDYLALSGTVVIPAGADSATIRITPANDALVESIETVIVTLQAAPGYTIGGATSATAFILSDDVSTVLLSAIDPRASEFNRDPAKFAVTRLNPNLNEPLAVRYQLGGTATNGADYDSLSGTVIIPAGATQVFIDIVPINDASTEPTETVNLTLLASSSYRLTSPSQTALIADNDGQRVSIATTDASAAEQDRDPAVFTVTRSGERLFEALTVTYRLGGSATAGADYDQLTGQVTIPAGATSATIRLLPIDDALVETREEVTVTLIDGANYSLGSAGTAIASIADNDQPTIQRLPVLMVIANRDFYYREYADTRASLESAGLRVAVAAATRTLSIPHPNSGQGADGGLVMPDIALTQARASDYSAIVFVGGWGSSAYQYAFQGTYQNSIYNGATDVRTAINQLINDFVHQDKYVTAICHGVSVLAWARVDGASPIADRQVSAYAVGAPASNVAGSTTTRWHVEQNGATMVTSRSIGNPFTAEDDVLVDGKIITAENYDSARRFGQVIAARLLG